MIRRSPCYPRWFYIRHIVMLVLHSASQISLIRLPIHQAGISDENEFQSHAENDRIFAKETQYCPDQMYVGDPVPCWGWGTTLMALAEPCSSLQGKRASYSLPCTLAYNLTEVKLNTLESFDSELADRHANSSVSFSYFFKKSSYD